MCARVSACLSIGRHYRLDTRNLIVITRSGSERKKEGEEEEEETKTKKQEKKRARLDLEGVRDRSLEKKRKRVASLHRCRFRALPLGATFAPGTAYANGKPAPLHAGIRLRPSSSCASDRTLSGRGSLFDYTAVIDGISRCCADEIHMRRMSTNDWCAGVSAQSSCSRSDKPA